jgi:hypothetical protein
VRQFGIRRNEAIACHVTVRGDKAMDLLERGLRVKEFELERANFSETGALSSHCGPKSRWGGGVESLLSLVFGSLCSCTRSSVVSLAVVFGRRQLRLRH